MDPNMVQFSDIGNLESNNSLKSLLVKKINIGIVLFSSNTI